mmetsp:Transcript_41730/g.126618  ORF Transcript_41730/g.126618 Transcript_41730/m.126618 type:complete len:209 (-) Transcript_41730:1043-1669(-)
MEREYEMRTGRFGVGLRGLDASSTLGEIQHPPHVPFRLGRDEDVPHRLVRVDAEVQLSAGVTGVGGEEVADLFVVNFEELHRDGDGRVPVVARFELGLLSEEHGHGAGDYSRIGLIPQHGVSLPTPRLTVGEYANVVPVDAALYQRLGRLPHVALTVSGAEDVVEAEVPSLSSIRQSASILVGFGRYQHVLGRIVRGGGGDVASRGRG